MDKEYIVEFSITGTCHTWVKASSPEEAKKKVDFDTIELGEWEVGDLISVEED